MRLRDRDILLIIYFDYHRVGGMIYNDKYSRNCEGNTESFDGNFVVPNVQTAKD